MSTEWTPLNESEHAKLVKHVMSDNFESATVLELLIAHHPKVYLDIIDRISAENDLANLFDPRKAVKQKLIAKFGVNPRREKKIAVIKEYREITGAGLGDAKQAVEEMFSISLS
jgi:ribosomal protein L7/L12